MLTHGRLYNFLIAIDQMLMSIVSFGAAGPDETMSSASWRLEQQGKLGGKIFRPIIDWLFSPWQKDHCKHAYESELARKHMKEI